MVLVTACAAANPARGHRLPAPHRRLPEYTYASGRIPGGFFKREGKPTDKEALTSRLIDRPIRPLSPSGWRYETQIIALVLSADTENDSDVLAITGASAALAISRSRSNRRLPACASACWTASSSSTRLRAAQDERPRPHGRRQQDAIVMVEAGAKESPRRSCVGARDGARGDQADHRRIDDLAGSRQAEDGRSPSETASTSYREVEEKAYGPLAEAMRIQDKLTTTRPSTRCWRRSSPASPTTSRRARSDAKAIFKELKEKVLRDEILERGKRLDGRAFDEIRPITSKSASCRGRTARASSRAARRRRWSPPRSARPTTSRRSRRWTASRSASCSTTTSRRSRSAKCKFLRGPGRREIGHGALAERALRR